MFFLLLAFEWEAMSTLTLHEPKLSNYPTMDEALAWLRAEGVPHKKLTDHHIKVDRNISWWPARGTIFRDGAKSRYPEPGRRALAKLLKLKEDDL